MLAKDFDDTLPQKCLVAKQLNVFVITIVSIFCLLASKICSSLATYAPNMSIAPPL